MLLSYSLQANSSCASNSQPYGCCGSETKTGDDTELAGGDNVRQLYHTEMVDDTDVGEDMEYNQATWPMHQDWYMVMHPSLGWKEMARDKVI